MIKLFWVKLATIFTLIKIVFLMKKSDFRSLQHYNLKVSFSPNKEALKYSFENDSLEKPVKYDISSDEGLRELIVAYKAPKQEIK
jgi:hypothetical protein